MTQLLMMTDKYLLGHVVEAVPRDHTVGRHRHPPVERHAGVGDVDVGDVEGAARH